MKKLSIFFIAFFSVSLLASAASRMVTGTVFGKDSDGKKAPLYRATVHWLGTKIGGFTDKEGNFKLEIPTGEKKLIVSYVGYLKDTIDVGSQFDNVLVELESSLKSKEILVQGDESAVIVSKTDVFKSETITQHGLRKAACCNLGESFQTNPSVDVNYSDAVTGAKQIQLLGLHGSYVQLLTEKAPNMRGLASTFGLNYIPGTWMETIQISKGSASVAEGYESITGQINVEYKKPISGDPLYLNLYANKSGMFEFNSLSAIEHSDKVGSNLLVHANYNNNEEDHNGDGFLDHPLIKQINIMPRFVYESGNFEGRISASALVEERRAGQKGFFDSDRQSLYGTKINTQRYQFWAKNGMILETENYNSIGTIVSATYHHQGAYFGHNDYDGTEKSFYANVLFMHEFQPKAHTTTIGASFLYDDYQETFAGMDLGRKETVPGVYAEYTMSAIKDLSVIGGVRADFHNDFGTFITPRFHVRYELFPGTILRGSAGKGWRTQNILSEYSSVLASSRKISIDEKIRPDEAWNYGVNISTDAELYKTIFTINAEYYRTDFKNQLIADFDKSPTEVHFYNLRGDSYSNSFQLDLNFSPIKHLTVMTAYRLNDVKMNINGELVDKPLVSRQKAFINLGYVTDLDEWAFDFTADWSSGGRLHNSQANPAEYRMDGTFPAFWIFNAQITKKFGDIDVYVGGENLGDFTQHHAIVGAKDPFGPYFDTSYVWGPLTGANFYVGVRWNVF